MSLPKKPVQQNELENKYEYQSFLKSAFAIQGTVTPKVMKLVLWVTLYACLISVIHSFCTWITISVSPFEYAGLVMGLILVFRINAGYDRWWEARKLWGTVVNSSRNIAIICTSYPKNAEKKKLEQLIGFIASLPYLMKNHLRQVSAPEEVQHLLDKSSYAELQKMNHRPNYISMRIGDVLSELVENKQLDQFAFLEAENHRGIIIDCQGACERILKTPMPFVMAIKARRFILLFLLILPVALAEYSLYINPFITALVAYALFSLDQIGIELQNPFSKTNLSHLPLDDICQTIEGNVLEISKSRKYPKESKKL